MASPITFKLTGFAELEKKLLEFGPEVARNGLRQADFRAAKVIRDAAKKSAPVKTGLLQANIYASRRRTPEHIAKYTVRVKPNVKVTLITKSSRSGKYHKAAPPSLYGRYLEFGTSKMRKHEFLRPAFFNNTGGALEQMRKGLESAVTRAAKKR